jgi:hypothetical protein
VRPARVRPFPSTSLHGSPSPVRRTRPSSATAPTPLFSTVSNGEVAAHETCNTSSPKGLTGMRAGLAWRVRAVSGGWYNSGRGCFALKAAAALARLGCVAFEDIFGGWSYLFLFRLGGGPLSASLTFRLFGAAGDVHADGDRHFRM